MSSITGIRIIIGVKSGSIDRAHNRGVRVGIAGRPRRVSYSFFSPYLSAISETICSALRPRARLLPSDIGGLAAGASNPFAARDSENVLCVAHEPSSSRRVEHARRSIDDSEGNDCTTR